MKLERSDIKYPLWRKKVDKSFLERKETPIPNFLLEQWKISETFNETNSVKDPNSEIKVYFKKNKFFGRILKKKNGQWKFNFNTDLADFLKKTFVMSFMRSIEERLRSSKNEIYGNQKIEEEIPFWEFIDLEFDAINKEMFLTAHYIQKPLYIELFKEIINSHVLIDIENKLNNKIDFKITKKDWRPKEDLKNEIDAKNVIYNLIDTVKKEIYIGEAESLISRFSMERKEIKGWDFYRFDSLPNGLSRKQRLEIERLIIRTFASFFENNKGINTKKVSDYKLVNKKIDS
jgi:hypothetical protein